MCSLSKEQSIVSMETIQNAFFFLLEFFILYQASHSAAFAPPCGAFVKTAVSISKIHVLKDRQKWGLIFDTQWSFVTSHANGSKLCDSS